MNKLIITLSLIILFINNTKCVNITGADLSCVEALGVKTQDTLLISTNVKSTLCSTPPAVCTSDGQITAIQINQKNRIQKLLWTDLQCLSSLNTFYGYNLAIDASFFYYPLSTIKRIFIYTSNIMSITQPLPLVDYFFFGMADSTAFYASYLKNVKEFYVDQLLNFQHDGDQTGSRLEKLTIICNTLPPFQTYSNLKTLDFTMGDSFSALSLNQNSGGLINLVDISFKSQYTIYIDFPTTFSNSSLNFTRLNIENQIFFNKPTNYIDLSNNNQMNIIINLKSVGNAFNIDGKFPFKGLPKSIDTLYITTGNFSTIPNQSLIENVTYLTLVNLNMFGTLPQNFFTKKTKMVNFGGNNLTGTIDDSWCSLPTLVIMENQLSGNLPNCFYCYLNDSTIYSRFTKNLFSNHYSNATCDYSQMFVSKLITDGSNVTLIGKNVGFYTYNIKTTPSIIFTTNNYNDSFSGKFSTSLDRSTKSVEIRFLIPGINFTVSISDTPPQITTVSQNENEFTIDGSFFSYDPSSIDLLMGNEKCNITSSTFYQIRCSINYPVIDWGEKQMGLIVDNKKSSFGFYLNYTKVTCSDNCNGNGICDDHTGNCQCFIEWTTYQNQLCNVSNQYVSSSSKVSQKDGGVIDIYGWFGDIHNYPYVLVEGENKTIISITNDTIALSIGPGKGSKNLKVVQNDIEWFGVIYPYLEPLLLCPDNCGGSEKGVCNSTNGECKCSSGWTGLDCKSSTALNSGTSKTVVQSTGSTTISNQDIGYLVLINSISEIDFNNNVVPNSIVNLLGNWRLMNKNGSISTFEIKENNNTMITMIIEQVETSNKQFNFAGNQFTINNGGFKISLLISNWKFKNNLNTLQIQMSTEISLTETNIDSSCGPDSVEYFSNSDDISNNINYLKITKNGQSLFGRFQDKMLSDGRPTTVLAKLENSENGKPKIITISLPHCANQCILDPDFSLLVSFSNSCSNENKRSWVLPVAIVVPIVTVSIIIVVSIILIKKNSIKIRIGLNSIKMKRKN
ncbi:hypothetical protein RB653_008323 [Dictyostelium firmibasis]|uniref:EGF-like domain-containing protein n=1 Tax=Dictyostelium firmibasis TaxID=79012 RepID=A0AAN7U057_9MYCE